jgi:hypothetical protein
MRTNRPEPLDWPAQGRGPRRRLKGLLIWSGVTLLAALALALAMVIASLAVEFGSESAPPTTSTIHLSPPGGHFLRQ